MTLLFSLLFSILPRSFNAVWLATYIGLDWPHQKVTTNDTMKLQQEELCRQFDQLKACGINTILFQTRLRGTSAYDSELEPYDKVFTGKCGKSPGYDPLKFAIEQAHKRGMTLHAWIVCFPVCRLADMKALGKRSLPHQHPELCYRSKHNYIMDPGVPNTAKYLSHLCADLVRRYNLDGIHLDYIRYPEHTVDFDDRATYRKYGQGIPKDQWRRNNVDQVVKIIHDSVRSIKPWVFLSCSPIGKFDDLPRYSSKGWNAYRTVSQDAVSWIKKGWMDILFPMLYFDGDNFYPFALDWSERCKRGYIAPGLGLYQLDPHEGNKKLKNFIRQLTFVKQYGYSGYALFRSLNLTENLKNCRFWVSDANQPLLLPPIHPLGLDSQPKIPKGKIIRKDYSLLFEWGRLDSHDSYNLYRRSKSGIQLIQAKIKESHFELGPLLPDWLQSEYLVTRMNSYGQESSPLLLQLPQPPKRDYDKFKSAIMF